MAADGLLLFLVECAAIPEFQKIQLADDLVEVGPNAASFAASLLEELNFPAAIALLGAPTEQSSLPRRLMIISPESRSKDKQRKAPRTRGRPAPQFSPTRQ
jgi:hypothetical protein